MTPELCERETHVIAAARSGAWPAVLEAHIAACAACAETKRLAQLFHRAAASAPSEPPPAYAVWQRLQAQRRELAIRRATQCMTLLCVLAALYAVALAAWYLPRLWHAELAADLSTLSSGIAFTGVLAAILAVLLGSCCFAYLGSRTDFRLRG